LAKEPCQWQLHLSVAEETYDGFSLLPDRCKKMQRKNSGTKQSHGPVGNFSFEMEKPKAL